MFFLDNKMMYFSSWESPYLQLDLKPMIHCNYLQVNLSIILCHAVFLPSIHQHKYHLNVCDTRLLHLWDCCHIGLCRHLYELFIFLWPYDYFSIHLHNMIFWWLARQFHFCVFLSSLQHTAHHLKTILHRNCVWGDLSCWYFHWKSYS